MTRGYFNVARYAIRSARCFASATPENGMTLPGIAAAGLVR